MSRFFYISLVLVVASSAVVNGDGEGASEPVEVAPVAANVEPDTEVPADPPVLVPDTNMPVDPPVASADDDPKPAPEVADPPETIQRVRYLGPPIRVYAPAAPDSNSTEKDPPSNPDPVKIVESSDPNPPAPVDAGPPDNEDPKPVSDPAPSEPTGGGAPGADPDAPVGKPRPNIYYRSPSKDPRYLGPPIRVDEPAPVSNDPPTNPDPVKIVDSPGEEDPKPVSDPDPSAPVGGGSPDNEDPKPIPGPVPSGPSGESPPVDPDVPVGKPRPNIYYRKPMVPRCKINEEWRCVNYCNREYSCKDRFNVIFCTAIPRPCSFACVCKPGYYRNYLGECISEAQCEQCSKPNEFYSCGSACDNECSNPNQNRTNCPIKTFACVKRCYCEDGYARDDKGNCIPKERCRSPKCKSNEVRRCVYNCPPEPTCKQPFIKYMCPRFKGPCKYKCVCRKGYVRNSFGRCIPLRKCRPRPLKCKRNEVEACIFRCPPERTCENRFRQYRCAKDPNPCKRKCVCKPGYYRNSHGICVTKNQCACKDPNEEYVLGKSCPPDTCISIVARFNCDQNEVAKYRCRCKSGYFRLTEGSPCIPMCDCPQLANSIDCDY